jgi:hypothetical protein
MSIIKTPRSKQDFHELIYRLWTPESIHWQHHDDWYGIINVSLFRDWASTYVVTLGYSNGRECRFEYRDVDMAVAHLWKYRAGMTETGRFDKNILEQACAIDELKISLDNITTDDGKELSELTEGEIIEQATYMLSMFNEEGTMQWEALVEDEDPDMIRQWHALQSFTARYAS